MLSGIATAGFAVAAFAFLAVAGILLLGWRGHRQAMAPLLAVGATIVWAGALAGLHAAGAVVLELVAVADGLRIAGWCGLLLVLLKPLAPPLSWRILLAGAAISPLLLLLPMIVRVLVGPAGVGLDVASILLGSIIGALAVLVMLEQLYRNTADGGRWALKYLCLGLGAVFAYDLFLYADALLGRRLDPGFWSARGYVNVLLAPLIAVSAARNPDWALDVYVSRRFVLHTATLAAAGVYLLLMAAVAYSIEFYGGAWAGPVQAVFLVGGLLLLLLLLFSGQIRARARVFLSKHFYNYRYDYREEWLRFSRTMTEQDDAEPLGDRVIRAVGQVVDSPGGVLWQVRDGQLVVVAQSNVGEPIETTLSPDEPLPRFLLETEWVLTLREWRHHPARYRDIELPAWLAAIPRAWALVPLLHHDRLEGFVVLTHPRTGKVEPNWEDFDLLKIIGRQAASYLAQEEAARALTRAQQFETFNRLSAFVLHDLKNIIGQLTMLSRNASRHRDNPAFMADAVDTLDHCVGRMNQLMNQLRGGLQAGSPRVFDLHEAVNEAVAAHADSEPVPQLEAPTETLRLRADRGRLVAVLGNVIQNGQEATDVDGSVRVRIARERGGAIVEVADMGTGMSQAFIRERLFQPFDTSKGSTGMGIGAFEAREYMRTLGGELEVESEPGEGTCFRFRFPETAVVETEAATPVEARQ